MKDEVIQGYVKIPRAALAGPLVDAKLSVYKLYIHLHHLACFRATKDCPRGTLDSTVTELGKKTQLSWHSVDDALGALQRLKLIKLRDTSKDSVYRITVLGFDGSDVPDPSGLSSSEEPIANFAAPIAKNATEIANFAAPIAKNAMLPLATDGGKQGKQGGNRGEGDVDPTPIDDINEKTDGTVTVRYPDDWATMSPEHQKAYLVAMLKLHFACKGSESQMSGYVRAWLSDKRVSPRILEVLCAAGSGRDIFDYDKAMEGAAKIKPDKCEHGQPLLTIPGYRSCPCNPSWHQTQGPELEPITQEELDALIAETEQNIQNSTDEKIKGMYALALERLKTRRSTGVKRVA